MINIKFDDTKVKDDKIIELSHAIQKIVIDTTGISEVFVYADSPRIKIDIAPIEVFIEMSASKVKDKKELFESIKTKLSDWKKESGFEYLVTITLTPVDWIFEVEI